MSQQKEEATVNSQSKLAETKYWVPTRNHGPKFGSDIKYVVIHVAVCCGGKPRTAHNLAKYLNSGADGRRVSWHYNVDSTTIVQSLDERYIGRHTGASATNDRSLGIEMCVYMPSSEGGWKEGYTKQVFDKTAELTHDLCSRHNIPMLGLTASQLRSGDKGVISHNLSRVVYGGTTHVDPGPFFPWQEFMDKVRSFSNDTVITPPTSVDTQILDYKQVLLSMAVSNPWGFWKALYRVILERDPSYNEVVTWLKVFPNVDETSLDEAFISILNAENV